MKGHRKLAFARKICSVREKIAETGKKQEFYEKS